MCNFALKDCPHIVDFVHQIAINFHVTHFHTGNHIGEILDCRSWENDYIYSIHTAGDTLMVPISGFKTVAFYKLEDWLQNQVFLYIHSCNTTFVLKNYKHMHAYVIFMGLIFIIL